MKLNTHFLKTSVIFSALLASSTALANQEGDILVRARLININPDGDSEVLGLDVEDHYSLDIDFTYMVSSNFGIELLLDTTSTHRITLGGNDVITTRVLPPSLIAQYHFTPNGKIRPYVGAGINYTLFLDEEGEGILDGAGIELDDSVGYVVQAGVDYDISNDWFFNVDIKYIDIDTTATITNSILGPKATDEVDVNPTILGVGIGTRF